MILYSFSKEAVSVTFDTASRKNQRLFSSIHDAYIYAFAQQGQKHIWKVQPTWPDFSQEKSPSIKRKL